MSDNKVLLLSGAPASGKDTVTSELIKINSECVYLKKHKMATGGKLDETYYLINKNEFNDMVLNNDFIQYHYRYNRGYGVSKKEFNLILKGGLIPIIHVGKHENIKSFINYVNEPLLSILLLVSREETKRRLMNRHNGNKSEYLMRMKAYEEEIDNIENLIISGGKLDFDLIIENSETSPKETALKINSFLL